MLLVELDVMKTLSLFFFFLRHNKFKRVGVDALSGNDVSIGMD